MNDEEFYARVDRTKFDMGIKALSADVLANIIKLLVLTDIHGRPPRNTKYMMTMATNMLLQQMLAHLKESFQDVDDFVASGKFPDYMQHIPDELKELLRRAASGLGDEYRK